MDASERLCEVGFDFAPDTGLLSTFDMPGYAADGTNRTLHLILPAPSR